MIQEFEGSQIQGLNDSALVVELGLQLELELELKLDLDLE